jgi:hypothetical protein
MTTYYVNYENEFVGQNNASFDDLIDTVVFCLRLIMVNGYVSGSLEVFQNGEDITNYIINILQKCNNRLKLKSAEMVI